jgi:hypothetical protein
MDNIKKRGLFIFLIFSVFIQVYAQTINLSESHNPSKEPVTYVVDFLQLDHALISDINFQRHDIVRSKTEGSKIIVTTKLLIVLDGKLLSTQNEKKQMLSTIDTKRIESVTKVDKEKAFELYGKKGKNGALIVKTKNN